MDTIYIKLLHFVKSIDDLISLSYNTVNYTEVHQFLSKSIFCHYHTLLHHTGWEVWVVLPSVLRMGTGAPQEQKW